MFMVKISSSSSSKWIQLHGQKYLYVNMAVIVSYWMEIIVVDF